MKNLLSESEGVAITAIEIEIEGANQDYLTLPGLQESVLHILFSIKQIVLASDIYL